MLILFSILEICHKFISMLQFKKQRGENMDSIISEFKKLFNWIQLFINKKSETLNNVYNSDAFAFVRGLNFEIHHVSKIFLISLIAFFITLHTTGLYTSDVEAYDVSSSVHTFNLESYEVDYGHCDELSEIAKAILCKKVSVINEPIAIKTDARHSVYEIDKYVAEIILLAEKTLGEVEAEFRISLKDTYYNGSKKVAELYSSDCDAQIEEGMVCIYKVLLNMKDVDAPVITLSTNDTTISETASFNEGAYVRSIMDNYDGNIYDYVVEGNDLGKNGDLVVGKHVLTYKVKDSSGNEASTQLIVRVKQKAKPKTYYKKVADSPYAGSIVAEARSLIGSQYIWGATGPYAFDCSGLVQYVYKRAGVYVPRTSGTQAHYGQAINPNDRSQWRAGDIITFGPYGSEHAAIYTGNGTMVHAINPSYGVRETGIYGNIYSVRRP